jgi:hypothetical protein
VQKHLTHLPSRNASDATTTIRVEAARNFGNSVVVNNESCLAALPESGNIVMPLCRHHDAQSAAVLHSYNTLRIAIVAT